MQNESIEAQRLAAEGAEVTEDLVKVPVAPGADGKPKKKPFRQRFKKEILAYSLIGIPLIWWCVFFVVALVWAFCTSFTDMRGGYGFDFVNNISFDNYINIFTAGTSQAEAFWNGMKVTVIWTVVMMIGNNFMGILCAFLIKAIKRGGKVFLALLFWPSLVSAVVGADITSTLFQSDNTGVVNQLIIACGGSPVAWFEDPNTAIWALMVIPFFFGFCQKMLIYYSTLVSIPDTYEEAASLETSSRFRIFIRVIFPLMKNALVLNTLLSIIDGFKVLGPMQLVTDGGPASSTQSAMLLIYKSVFNAPARIGQGCAYAFVLFIFILIVSIIQKVIAGKEESNIE